MVDSASNVAVMFQCQKCSIVWNHFVRKKYLICKHCGKSLHIMKAPATFTLKMPIQVCGLQLIVEMKKAKLQLGLSQSSCFMLRRSCKGFVVMLNLKP